MEWLFGGPAGWQEGVAAVIVAAAVVSLYRHLRGMFGVARPGGGGAGTDAGCHGCASDCEEPNATTDPTVRGSLH